MNAKQLIEAITRGFIGHFDNGGLVLVSVSCDQLKDGKFDHTDAGWKVSSGQGRFRYDPVNKPDTVVWSDEPSADQREQVEDRLFHLGFKPKQHTIWSFSDTRGGTIPI